MLFFLASCELRCSFVPNVNSSQDPLCSLRCPLLAFHHTHFDLLTGEKFASLLRQAFLSAAIQVVLFGRLSRLSLCHAINGALGVYKSNPYLRPSKFILLKIFIAASRVPAMHYRHHQTFIQSTCCNVPCAHSSAHLLSRKGISSPLAAREPSISAFQDQYSPNRISAYEA